MAQQIRPPEANTKKPRFTPPPKSCDTAVHVFPPVARFPVSEKRIYDPPAGADFADLARMHRTIGVSRGVIIQATAYRTDCRSTLAALEYFGPAYRGVVILDDGVTDAELAALDRAGVRGVRFNFAKFLGIVPDLGTFQRVTHRVSELGWHILLHVQPPDLLEHADLFRSLRATCVIDHLAHLELHDEASRKALPVMTELLKDGRWWIKLSNGDRTSHGPAPWADVVEVGRTLAALAPERAIWGTDWPHVLYQKPEMVNDGDLMDLLADFVPDEAVRRRILVDNPAALYGFTDWKRGP
jgi:predicted TIM-barrel fold metal-dependent hydrolase